jgi:hypothetical protein
VNTRHSRAGPGRDGQVADQERSPRRRGDAEDNYVRVTPIPIKGYPFPSYDTFEQAISASESDPRQAKARADADELKGAHLSDAAWTSREFWLTFDNGRCLYVFMARKTVCWRVMSSPPLLDSSVLRIGAKPVVFDWGGEVGESTMDVSSLLASRLGAEFTQLYISIRLGVHTYKHLSLDFYPCFRSDTGEDVLHVDEEQA